MIEIRWHGRGGQGAKTAAMLFAETAIEEGKFAQGFPEYGPERMGAPVKGFTRIDDKPIRVHSGIENPRVVVVLDQTLLETIDVTEGMPEDGILIINTEKSPEQIRKQFGIKKGKIYTVNATKIALDTIGRPIPNTVMLGALIKVTGVLDLDTLLKNIVKKFSKKFSDKVVEGNVQAIKKAFEEVKGE
ncbi:2-oxoacid:acceptor oxidoreductase family protein [Candidatus Kryptonium thompsonii]|jgi:pyruvate ferredoxin oxidoreductase gamma subunit|uniref:2-oxoacid:acceptor oxidoreductase family protein n=1 Tax=Candidatus Kryptonium thompsonii TaxID=1633631 RepID=UPI00070826D7|nr:2-oxoacid:acceptor oxidoreductase family protein [Candidatus Kryptonium thompsoni]CUS85304.1 pyruvate ferredoxin oxidoreductase, gamma subunit [Candidatus Kryptonium thompsoni]